MTEEVIYQRPEDYDLEHEGDDEDARLFCRVLRRFRPARVLELACGTGRVTLAMAKALPQSRIIGLDASPEMLLRARRAFDLAPEAIRARVSFTLGDMRSWHDEDPFDAVVVPCCSVSHLLTIDDRLATWRNASQVLRPDGVFVVDVRTPDLATLAESQRMAPRSLLQWDIDARSHAEQTRLVRCTASVYQPHEQRSETRFFYDRFDESEPIDRFVSNFASHIYFPSEVELLFATTGFTTIERFGDYDGSVFGRLSPYLITLAQRAPGSTA
jgi:SAM-dependent methyltransferase